MSPTTRRLTRSLLIVAAAAVMIAATPGDPVAISNTFYRASQQLLAQPASFNNASASIVSAAVRKLEKADNRHASDEALTAIVTAASAKLQAKGDKVVAKIFQINDKSYDKLSNLLAEDTYFNALAALFVDATTAVSDRIQTSNDVLNAALAVQLSD